LIFLLLISGGLSQINLSGSLIVQRLMKPLFAVEPEIAMDSGSRLSNRFIFTQINGFIFERSPQSFDKDVVQSPTSTVHAYFDSPAHQSLYPPTAGELGPLISVEDLRRHFSDRKSPIESLHAELDIQRRRQGPR